MSLKKNTIANYLGQGWTALMGLAFIPIYIRYLGVEAWGLIGFMSMLQAWLTLLDMGLTPTLNREMARFSAGGLNAQSIRNLLRSLEILYGGVALTVVLVVWLAAPWLVEHWLKIEHFPLQDVAQAISIMGLVLATRMIEQVYRGAMQGLQHQVWLNIAQGALATLRWGGAVGVLAWVSPTIAAFFLWQGLVSVLTIAVFAFQTYRWLPATPYRARFDSEGVKRIRRFAGGMAATTLLALLLTQVDKLLLSKLLSLEQFGYYMLAASVAGGLSFLVSPLSTAISPRLTELVTRSDHAMLVATYHQGSQWMAAILIPPALLMAAFSEALLWAWTDDALLARRAAPLLSLLALGTMCNGFMHVPYMTQLAHGWTGFAVRVNIIAVAIIVPVIFWAVPRYGGVGAAWAWLVLNAGYVLIGMHFMHRKLLPAEKWRWYREAIFQPFIIGGIVITMLKLVLPTTSNRLLTALLLVLATAMTAAAVAASTPEPRAFLLRQVIRLRGVFTHGNQ
jgi:O-antigen/teichoic acid export membrane protein